MPNFIIRNFQSISEAKLKVEGLTLLVGESSSGKTACFRAVFAATNNRFKNGQVKNGQDSAVVKVQMPDSADVFTAIRPWAGSIKMALGNERFDKIGRTLPKQIDDFLQFGTLDVGGEKFSLNFHDQFQKPLLLEFSQQRVMEILSASKGIDDLNFAKDTIQDLRVQNKGAFKAIDAILTEAKENLSETKSKVERFEGPVNDLEEAWSEATLLNKQSVLLSQAISLLQEHDRLEALVSVHKQIVSECTSTESVEEEKSRLSLLHSSVEDWAKLSVSADRVKSRVGVLSQLVEEDVTSAKNKRLKLQTLEVLLSEKIDTTRIVSRIDIYKELIAASDLSDITLKKGKIQSLEILHVQESEIDARVAELEEIIVNHICPVCHSKVTE